MPEAYKLKPLVASKGEKKSLLNKGEASVSARAFVGHSLILGST